MPEVKLGPSLLLDTIIWPLGLGIVLALVASVRGTKNYVQVFITSALILAIYLLLEGVPSFPPLAAKQKVSFIIVGIAACLALTPKLQLKTGLVTIVVLGLGFTWLGFNKLHDFSAWPSALLVMAPIITAAFSSRSLETRADETFLWPSTLIAFAIGGSLISLFGVFVGFAQAMGAMAAWIGGYMMFQFFLLALGGRANALSSMAMQVVLLSFVVMSFMVALFAPDVSLLAYAVLSLTLLVPQFAPELRGLSPLTKPFVFGFLAAVPAVAAILIAFVQRGLSIG